MSTSLNHKSCVMAEHQWTVKMVEEHFREAILTLKKLSPLKQRVYLNAWPEVIHSSNELLQKKKNCMFLHASPEAISRLDRTFEWMSWVTLEERKLIWKRANNKHWKLIAWELGCDRTTAWRKWVLACTKIAIALNVNQDKAFGVATK